MGLGGRREGGPLPIPHGPLPSPLSLHSPGEDLRWLLAVVSAAAAAECGPLPGLQWLLGTAPASSGHCSGVLS